MPCAPGVGSTPSSARSREKTRTLGRARARVLRRLAEPPQRHPRPPWTAALATVITRELPAANSPSWKLFLALLRITSQDPGGAPTPEIVPASASRSSLGGSNLPVCCSNPSNRISATALPIAACCQAGLQPAQHPQTISSSLVTSFLSNCPNVFYERTDRTCPVWQARQGPPFLQGSSQLLPKTCQARQLLL